MLWAPGNRILAELSAMPRGSFGQNVLRMSYWCRRANDLGRKPEYPGSTITDTLMRAIADARSLEPSFEPNINWAQLDAASRSDQEDELG